MTKILGVQQLLALNLRWFLDRLCQAQKPNCPTPSTTWGQNQEQKIWFSESHKVFGWFPVGISFVFNSTLCFHLNHPARVKQQVTKSQPDTEHEQEACRQFYGCDSASAGAASLDFTSLGILLILRWACNSSTMALRDFLFFSYRRFLENRNSKQNKASRQMTKQFVNKYVYTEKLKGGKTNWQTNIHEASLGKKN